MVARQRNHWGWGFADARHRREARRAAAALRLVEQLGFGSTEVEDPVPLPTPRCRAARLTPPAPLAAICSARRPRPRAATPRQVLPRRRPRLPRALRPRRDLVARPRDEAEVEARARLGGRRRTSRSSRSAAARASSAASSRGSRRTLRRRRDARSRARSTGCSRSTRSRAPRASAPAPPGPRLEAQLGAHGLTLRFYPQSFELSTLGGWIATRAGGHFATRATHVDDLVESVRAITPGGHLGVATAARLGRGPLARPAAARLGGDPRRHHRGVGARAAAPAHRAGRTVRFAPFLARAPTRSARSSRRACARQLPADRRAGGRGPTGAGDGSTRVLVLGFESTDHDRSRHELARGARRSAATHGGEPDEPRPARRERRRRVARGVPAHALPARHARAPRRPRGHLRDRDHVGALARLPRGRRSGATRAALRRALRAVTCRFTHVYPDGPAPYFTVLAPARRGDELEQWARDQGAASDAILAAGGTITHHHAVGRDHRRVVRRASARSRSPPRCARPRPPSTRAGILNPGVLLDP